MPTTTNGIPMPEARPCEHCGRVLQPHTAKVAGHVVFAGWEPCDCPGALEEQRRWEEEHERAVRGMEADRLAERVEQAGIPPRYREATHPWAEHMANLVREGRGFYVWGPNGTGKTHLACSAALLCLKAGLSVQFANATELLEALREFGDGQRALLSRLERCDLLVIDDFGKEGAAAPRSAERLYELFNRRYNAEARGRRRPVIVTSNFPRGEVADRVSSGGAGVAIASRLAGTTQPVEMAGKDRRKEDGKRRHSAKFPARFDG